jgi:glycosyltransferase involved in cell wall biosynthesis
MNSVRDAGVYAMKSQSSNKEACAIIPAYNEESRIGETLEALAAIACFDRIIVVDDGSSDHTAEIAMSKGAEVIRLPENHGKAYALKKGLNNSDEDIVAFLDADLGKSASEACRLVEPIFAGRADASVARFPLSPGKGGFGFVKLLAATGIRLLTGRPFPSVLSGQRAFSRGVVRPEMLDYKGFGVEFGMTVDLLNSRVRLVEVDVKMHHRTTGRDISGFIHRLRQFRDIFAVLISKLIRIIPRKIMDCPEDR